MFPNAWAVVVCMLVSSCLFNLFVFKLVCCIMVVLSAAFFDVWFLNFGRGARWGLEDDGTEQALQQ